MTRVGNQTNSTDPHSINSRIFVGNLNTYLVAKEELENIFQRYGKIRGISMHKGYAFVQFMDTWDARNAVMGEDGRTVAGQVIDVNMVLEPKPHQIERKRSNIQSSTPLSNYVFARQLMPPLKRSKTDLMGFPPKPKIVKMDRLTQPIFQANINLSDDSDILICGNCKELFTCLQKFFEHKQRQCKLRFLCKCHQNGTVLDDPKEVHCFHCQIKCSTWWELVQHVQGNHGISIYRQIGEDMNTKSNAFKNGSQMTILSTSTSETSADAGKETNSCCSDTPSGLVENEWEMTQERQKVHDDLLSQIIQNHEKAVDTADLQELVQQG